jgi:putative ABC transport system ATP-binding protein
VGPAPEVTAKEATDPPVSGRSGGAGILVRGLSHGYRAPGGSIQVLRELDLDVEPGGYVTIGGRSGAGKSTLLAILGGLERHRQGRVVVGDTDLSTLSGDGLASYRRATVGFVFQHFGLLDTLTASENVELASALARTPIRARRRRAGALLSAVGLVDRMDHRPHALSGGERQRVAIARSLANAPALILADEPTGNLDEDSAADVAALLEQMHGSTGCTLLIVTHNRLVAKRAPLRYVLEDGRIRAA